MPDEVFAKVSMWIDGRPEQIFEAFLQPEALTQFWLSAAEAPLEVDRSILWSFLVPGAEVQTTATCVERPHTLEWNWSDGSRVSISMEEVGGGTAITIVNDRLAANGRTQIAAALDATEGFSVVLADLKTWIETGSSAGITRGKAKMIELRREGDR